MFAVSMSALTRADHPEPKFPTGTSGPGAGPQLSAHQSVGRGRITAIYSSATGWRPVPHGKAVSPPWLRKLVREGVSAVEVDDGAGRSEHMIADLLAPRTCAPLRVAGVEPSRTIRASERLRPPQRRDGPGSRHVAPDSHRAHGERAKYVVEGCRCSPCRAANTAYGLRRGRARRRPEQLWVPYVPAGRARRHVKRLGEQGVGLKSVAKLSGVSYGSLVKLVYGEPSRGRPPSKRIRSATEQAILSVQAHQARGAQRLPAAPSWKLIDDLLARGFSRVLKILL